MKRTSIKGYQAGSPDRHRPFNIIPSGSITMHQVPHPVLGMDNTGVSQLMLPGMNYQFPGTTVLELPVRKRGGKALYQQGGSSVMSQAKSTLDNEGELIDPNTSDTTRLVYLADLANAAIASGQNPAATQQGRILFAPGAKLPGTEADLTKLYYSIHLFNQRNDVKQLSPEQRLDLYYNTLRNDDKDVEAFKAKVRTFGYGVVPAYRHSRNLEVLRQQEQDRALATAPAPAAVSTFQQGGVTDVTNFVGAQHINPFYANSFFTEPPEQLPVAANNPGHPLPAMIPYPPTPLSVAARFPTIPQGPPSLAMTRPAPTPAPAPTSWTGNVPAAQQVIAGMSFLGNALEAGDRNRAARKQQQQGWSDFTGIRAPVSRGDYTVNEGYFRPDQLTPVQFGAVPMAQSGGYFDTPLHFTGLPAAVPMVEGSELPSPVPSPAKKHPVEASAKDAYTYYVDEKGLPSHIAAGIVGNLYQESGLQPTAKEKGNTGNGRGIAQWDVRDRWKGLLSWAAKQNKDPYTLKTQLDYILAEPGESGKVLAKLKNTRTPEEAAYAFGKTYERPSEKHARWDVRTTVARQLAEGTFQQGGEYDVSPEDLFAILQQGGEVEFM